jgi:hypothetical protein
MPFSETAAVITLWTFHVAPEFVVTKMPPVLVLVLELSLMPAA